MDLKQIKELMSSMEKAKIKRLKIKTEKGFEVVLEKESPESPEPRYRSQLYHPEEFLTPSHGQHTFPHHALPPHKHSSEGQNLSEHEEKKETAGLFITSPMVGTFYSSPSPEDPPFIKVGDKVTEESVVCIVEAMKVMNEVKAGVKGKVAEVLIENGHPVEFGTKMFRIV